ncbi:uncharacterized protein VTP21DRAFT_8597 [Calcarisporiella thermophila]|uniref:uncharacterized protein n=1 Tax=Calcarisporiella thermophila TaxID=911321 RepID=UPI0037434DE8
MKFAISDGELAINFASIVCATLIMFLVAFLRYTQPQATRSVSFRLSFWIGLADALYRSFYVMWMEVDFRDTVIASNLWFGRIVLWSFYFFPMWFSLLTVSIALDLQLSAFHKHLNIARFQWWYLPVSTLVPLALSSPFLFYGNLVYNSKIKIIILDWPFGLELALTVLVSVVVFACILYSFTIIFACAIKVFSMVFRVRREKDLHGEKNRLRERLVMMSVTRLLGYPLVLIICLPAECIILLLYVTKSRDTAFGDSTGKAKAILTGLQGVFNLIIFLFNPAFSGALSQFKLFKDVKYMKYWNRTAAYSNYAKKYPHLQQVADDELAMAPRNDQINGQANDQLNVQQVPKEQDNQVLSERQLKEAKKKADRILIPFSSGLSEFSTC